MSAESLRHELSTLGLVGNVEAIGSLAVLTLEREQPLDEQTRAQAVALAVQHGFTHVALELPGARDDRAALHRP